MTLKTFISLFLFLTTASFSAIKTSYKTYSNKHTKDTRAKSLELSVQSSLAKWDERVAWHEISEAIESKHNREQSVKRLNKYCPIHSIQTWDENGAWQSISKDLHPYQRSADLEIQKKLDRIKKEEAEKTWTISKMIEYATKKSKPDVLISQLEQVPESYYWQNPGSCTNYLSQDGSKRNWVKNS